MNENSDMQIDISGYSDNTGSDEFNNKLSYERAKAVADYLREKKIKKKRLSWKGYGNTMPVANNNSLLMPLTNNDLLIFLLHLRRLKTLFSFINGLSRQLIQPFEEFYLEYQFVWFAYK